MSKKRLFVAIGLPDSVIEELESLQKKLKPFARDAKWVRTAGIHLTLKFLGYVEPERIPEITQSLAEVTKDQESFPVQAKGCGFFPNPRRPSVLWVGVESMQMIPLQERVEAAMAALGFEKENRPFTPHLTLARFKDPRGLLPLSYEIERYSGKMLGEFTAQSFSLYESILHRQGAEYHVLHDFLLTQKRRETEK